MKSTTKLKAVVMVVLLMAWQTAAHAGPIVAGLL